MRYELEYRWYWIEIRTRSTLGSGRLEYLAEVRVTADPEEARVRHWTPVNGAGLTVFRLEADALEDGMRRGFAYVDALNGSP
jgi:hypothetical protein